MQLSFLIKSPIYLFTMILLCMICFACEEHTILLSPKKVQFDLGDCLSKETVNAEDLSCKSALVTQMPEGKIACWTIKNETKAWAVPLTWDLNELKISEVLNFPFREGEVVDIALFIFNQERIETCDVLLDQSTCDRNDQCIYRIERKNITLAFDTPINFFDEKQGVCLVEQQLDLDEKCDLIDNDCDHKIDEEIIMTDLTDCPDPITNPDTLNAQCIKAVSAECIEGKITCSYGNPNQGIGDGTEEACDLIDNDCDGVTDEDFPLAGQTCEISTEGCQGVGSGIWQCDPKLGKICYRDVSENTEMTITEQCDDLDNDCDGKVDEDFIELIGQACDSGNICFTTQWMCQNLIPNELRSRVVEIDFPQYQDVQARGLSCVKTLTPLQPEICDGADNDCDGQIDNGIDKNTIENCGACGNSCTRPNSIPSCLNGACEEICNFQFYNANLDWIDGCEYFCDVEVKNEICNLQDDDCDAKIDETFNLNVDVNHCGNCQTTCQYPNAIPNCNQGQCGIQACLANFYNLNGSLNDGCEYACTPSNIDVTTNLGVEICDGLDNDCDGWIDEDFDFSSLNHCGVCFNSCIVDHAQTICQQAQDRSYACQLVACNQGFVNFDGLFSNGCECEVRPETCNFIDDDCDGLVDEDRVCATDLTRYCKFSMGWAKTEGLSRDVNSRIFAWSRNYPAGGAPACVTNQVYESPLAKSTCAFTTGSNQFSPITMYDRVDREDWLGIYFKCDEDPLNLNQINRVLNWVDQNCSVALAYQDVTGDQTAMHQLSFNQCEKISTGNGIDTTPRCIKTIPTIDRLAREFSYIQLQGFVDYNDRFGIAFNCQNVLYEGRSVSLEMQKSLEFFIGLNLPRKNENTNPCLAEKFKTVAFYPFETAYIPLREGGSNTQNNENAYVFAGTKSDGSWNSFAIQNNQSDVGNCDQWIIGLFPGRDR